MIHKPIPSTPGFIDLTGRRFKRLSVIGFAGFQVAPSGKRKALWNCRCECSAEVVVAGANLKSKNSKSCGCWNQDRKSIGTHGQTKGGKVTGTYKSWCGMIERCSNPNNKIFKNYGGRGITVCDEWRAFEVFLRDMGERPKGTSIDRINNNQGYYPGNCKWSNQSQQMRNTRRSRMIECFGETKCMTEWAEITGLRIGTIWNRLKRGMTAEAALSTPVKTTR